MPKPPTLEHMPSVIKLTASHMEALSWESDVLAHSMAVGHGAVGIDDDRVVYTMTLQLAMPLPPAARAESQFLCLTWPIGGLWRINSVDDSSATVVCESWRRTTMSRAELAHEQEEFQAKVDAGEDVGTLFEWKMMRGVWGADLHHWFLRSIEPPLEVSAPRRTLVAKLLVGLAPFAAQLEVNAIMAVDTVAQTFTADVTWQVALPGITAIREDSVLREFLDILEFDPAEFEFTNVNAMQDERPLATSVTPAGEAQFRDATLDQHHVTQETVYHLQYTRRIIATFSQEMALHNFPFDQQKLSFDFSSGSGMPDGPLRLAPMPVDPGSFSIENYRLANVFDVVYHNMIFVREICDSGPKKTISFEIMLERRSGYYLTNVALISACITYLSFVTYAPVEGSTLMDVSSRLQIVLTLLLTAVTFKSQVASLIPQVSYFTTLDKYVFFCFLVTCFVTLENALFPLLDQLFPGDWNENGLLAFSCGTFTAVNVVWIVYLKLWVLRRRRSAQVLLEINEFIRVISEHFPAGTRFNVLREYFVERKIDEADQPHIHETADGNLHIHLPEDSPTGGDTMSKTAQALASHKQRALVELSSFQKIYARIHPGGVATMPSSLAHVIPAVRPNAAYVAAEPRGGRRASNATRYSDTGTTRSSLDSGARLSLDGGMRSPVFQRRAF